MSRYPIGRQNFEYIRENDLIYVDKTELIYNLLNYSFVFLARPRRFGKSLLLSTIKAFFEGKKDLFRGLAIYEKDLNWESYPILHLQFSSTIQTETESLKQSIEEQFLSWEEGFNIEKKFEDIGVRFRYIIRRITEKLGKRVVILIDEYDNPLINSLYNTEVYNRNKEILKSIFSSLKDMDEYIRFGFMTGVSRFTNNSVYSGMNQMFDITFDKRYSTICGFTKDELIHYFSEGISLFAKKEEITSDEILTLLKKEYDGYHFSSDLIDIYNPFSILNCLDRQEISDYWIQTGTPEFLKKVISNSPLPYFKLFQGIEEEQRLTESDTSGVTPVSILYQTGYLTIKSFDKKFREYYLGIPNSEVKSSILKDLMRNLDDSKSQFHLFKSMKNDLETGQP